MARQTLGNGQGGKSMQDRELAAEVRKLTLLEIKKALKGKDKDFKEAIILRLAVSILPRLNEHSGPDGLPIPIYASLSRHNNGNKDIPINEKDSSDKWGNRSEQDC